MENLKFARLAISFGFSFAFLNTLDLLSLMELNLKYMSKKEVDEPKEEQEDEELIKKDEKFSLPEPETIKTFTRDEEPEDEEIKKEETKKDESLPFKTTNIDLGSEHSLDDLVSEDSPSLESPIFPSQTTNPPNFDEGPHIPPLGSHMHPGMVGAHKKSGSSKSIHLIILLIVGIAVIGATVYLLKGGSLNKPSPSPTSAPVVVPSPIPSPSPEVVDRSKFNIRVLNGTAKSGLAASVSARLRALGYLSDKTGNATNSAFTQTVVRVKTTATKLLEQLIKDLQPDFSATSAGNLQDSDSVDGEVIIGAK